MKPKIIVAGAQKGGVGKSSLVWGIASFLCQEARTLVIDLDPQRTLSNAVALSFEKTSFDVLTARISLREAIAPAVDSFGENLFCIPASQQLAGIEVATAGDLERHYLISDALKDLNDFEYVILDTPAGLGLLSSSAIVAADQVLTPTLCSPASLETLAGFEKYLEQIKRRLNPNLQWLLVPNQVSASQVIDREILELLHATYGDRMTSAIPKRVSLVERMAAQKPCDHTSIEILTQQIKERMPS